MHTDNTANTVNHILHELLADGVVATGVCIALAFASPPHAMCEDHTVVGRILLAADQLLRVKQLAEAAGPDLVDGLNNH